MKGRSDSSRSRQDLNNPPTAVGGICGDSSFHTVSAVGGIWQHLYQIHMTEY